MKRNKIIGILLSGLIVSSGCCGVLAAAKHEYKTSVYVDSKKSQIGASRKFSEKSIKISVNNPEIGGDITTSDDFTIEIGNDYFLTGWSKAAGGTYTLKENVNNSVTIKDTKSGSRSRSVKFKAGYSMLNCKNVTISD